MRFSQLSSAAALFALASAQGEATKYYDPETGITFSSVTHSIGVTQRIALPTGSNSSDAIYQIVAPNEYGWCGLAWGGHMTNNPLSVAWPTGETSGPQAIVSSRMAFQYYAVPSPYEGAEYTLLKGTTTNATHWQVTARCRGCTSWSSADGDFNLHNDDQAILAYACSSVTPDEKTSNTSTFNIHEQFGIWSHELSFAKNESFGDWVKANEVQEEGEVVERRWYA